MVKGKDERWAKQFGDFAENLVMYTFGQLKNMSVALIDHVGADVIASDRTSGERYAISVKGRNFPETESKSFNFSQSNIDKLSDTAKTFGMIPAVAFVFVDDMEQEKKIRIFGMKLDDMFEMCENPEIEFLNYAMDGITFKYTEHKNVKHLSVIKNCKEIDYSEMQFTVLNSTVSFL